MAHHPQPAVIEHFFLFALNDLNFYPTKAASARFVLCDLHVFGIYGNIPFSRNGIHRMRFELLLIINILGHLLAVWLPVLSIVIFQNCSVLNCPLAIS
jgi:hypothetical protein